MSIIASKGYYRFIQVLSVLVVPIIVIVMVFCKIDDRIIVIGVVESTRHVLLRSSIDKTLIEKILVEPGKDVEEGQPLIVFRDLDNWKLELEKTRLQIDKNRLQLQKTSILLAKTIGQMETKREKADTYEKLNKEGAQAALAAKELRTEADSLEKDAEALKKDVDLMAKDVSLMEANAKGLEQQIARLTLRAPFKGRVTDVLVREPMNVTVGTELLALSAMDDKVVRCFVPENRADRLEDGLNVTIKSNLYNYLHYSVFRGKVKKHYPYGTRAPDGAPVPAIATEAMPTYETFITIGPENNGPQMLKVGSTVTCEIIVERQPLYKLFIKTD